MFGLQRVPTVCRLVEYGKCVCSEGKRSNLYLASIPNKNAAEIADFISNLFEMSCDALTNYLSITMTPSNPILHTTRLATMFEDYTKGMVYDKNPLFYGEWTNESSERLLACDNEHQKMLRMLDKLDLTSVKSLIEHYDNSDTPEKLTAKMCSIKSLQNLSSPMNEVEGGWVPDFNSRYFTADFPYGLAIISELIDIVGASAPQIKKTMQWYRYVTGKDKEFELSSYGIKTVEDIYQFYS